MCRVCSAASTCCCCLRLFCSLLHYCMWHVWLMRHYPKVSQANNFRQQGEAKKAQRQTELQRCANKNSCILHGKASTQAAKLPHGALLWASGSSENFIDFVVALQCPRLRPRFAVYMRVHVCVFLCVCVCVCLSLMKRLACRAAPYCLQHMLSQAQPCPALA